MPYICDRCGTELAYTGKGRPPVRCEACSKLKRAEDNLRYRQANPGSNYERVKKWRAENPEKRNEQTKRHRANSDAYAVRHRAEVDKWRKANPEKHRAQAKLQYAVATGKMQRQPCEVCGEPQSTAHHEDYARPYDVQWLCRRCHNQLHNSRR